MRALREPQVLTAEVPADIHQLDGVERAAAAPRGASGVRGLTRSSLHANRAVAPVEIDVRTGEVSLGGRRLAVGPVPEVPLSRRYLLR